MFKLIFILVLCLLAVSKGENCKAPYIPCEKIQKIANKCDLVKVQDLIKITNILGVKIYYDHTFLYASSDWFVEVNSRDGLFQKNEGYKRRGVVSQAYGGECCKISNDDYSHLTKRSAEDCTERFRECIENDYMGQFKVYYSISKNNCEHYATRWKYYTDKGESTTFKGFLPKLFKIAADLVKSEENGLPDYC